MASRVSPLYRSRRRRNVVTMGLSFAATAFGLTWLVLILAVLLWNGVSGLSLRVFTEMTPPPGSSGGLLNPIMGSLIMTFVAVAIGTPLGILVARVRFVRAAIGPILSGLQSLPSVAWVPPAVIWLGLNDSMMFAVILLGAVPSIANGLVAGIDQIPPLFLRAGRTLGATGLRGARHIVMPAALPGYVAGLKQGWAFSWRSLMAAEIIASSPDLGVGLGQLLENGRNNSSMPQVFLAILLILCVGIAIDLLIFSPLERRVLRGRGLLVSR